MTEAVPSLEQLGFQSRLRQALSQLPRDSEGPLFAARVLSEHRGSYRICNGSSLRWAKLTGKLRHTARDRRDHPAVGDWVATSRAGQIVALLPRHSEIVRQASGERPVPQVVAANVDSVFVVTSPNADFNVRRLERYVSAIEAGGAEPVLVINKADLADPEGYWAQLPEALSGYPTASVSAAEGRGKERLLSYCPPGKTIALLGSSGVGKSTIVNWLLGKPVAKTQAIRTSDDEGRHTTTHRELFVLPDGGCLIDTPGMRQFAPFLEGDAALQGFDDVQELAARCRFSDCQHAGQPGCAVEQALAQGTLAPERLESYRRLSEATERADRHSGTIKRG